MRVKDVSKVSQWSFQLIDPDGNEVRIPNEGGFSSLQQVTGAVLSYITVYDNATKGEYSKNLQEEADKLDLDLRGYLSKLIQHQLCLTNKAVACWSDGFGDNIHRLLGKVDSYVEKAPAKVKQLMQTAISRMTPSRARSFSSCGACGGTRVMDPKVNNLGRAGRFNRFGK